MKFIKNKKTSIIWSSGAILGGVFISFLLIKSVFYLTDFFTESDLFNKFARDESVGLGGPNLDDIDKDSSVSKLSQKRYVVKGSSSDFPNIHSTTFLVGDVETGQIIASKQRDAVHPIASLTKLMTAVVADEKIGLQEETVISKTAISTYGSSGNLRRGEKYNIETLLYPLLLSSSNDAAEAIAEFDNRHAFMLDMNSKTKELNMENTYYDDPSGLSAKNVSSVNDLFKLVRYVDKYRRYIFEITNTKRYRDTNTRTTWYNNSRFTGLDNYFGGKNGYTDEAGKTNIAIYELPLEIKNGGKEEGYRKVAIIVFDSRNPLSDTKSIVNYLNKFVYYE